MSQLELKFAFWDEVTSRMLTLAKLVLKFESANTSCASVTRLMSQLKQDYIAKMESSRLSPYKSSSVLSPGPKFVPLLIQ